MTDAELIRLIAAGCAPIPKARLNSIANRLEQIDDHKWQATSIDFAKFNPETEQWEGCIEKIIDKPIRLHEDPVPITGNLNNRNPP